jgi:uncharacterized protein with FMN-binding domain
MDLTLRVFLFFIITGSFIIYNGYQNDKEILKDISNIDFSIDNLDDGLYVYNYKSNFNSFKIIVEVEYKKIVDINFENLKVSFKGKKAYKNLPKKILKDQTLLVDSISGATFSSNIIKFALLKALNKKNRINRYYDND